jgi:hypothetical protein
MDMTSHVESITAPGDNCQLTSETGEETEEGVNSLEKSEKKKDRQKRSEVWNFFQLENGRARCMANQKKCR